MFQHADFYLPVLHEIKKESTEEAGTVGSEGNSTATQAGAVPQGDITTANVNNTPTVADNSAARIAELEVKVQALEKKVENKVDKWGPRPDIKASTEGGTFSIKANNMNNNKDPRVHLRPRAAHAQKRKAVDPPPQSSADLVPSRTRSHPTTVLLVMNTLIS